MIRIEYVIGMGRNQGRRHEYLTGGTDPEWGTDSGESKPLTPNSDFSSDFSHFILEILENPKVLANIPKLLFKNVISGGTSPEFRTGGHVPPHPPGGDAHRRNEEKASS